MRLRPTCMVQSIWVRLPTVVTATCLVALIAAALPCCLDSQYEVGDFSVAPCQARPRFEQDAVRTDGTR